MLLRGEKRDRSDTPTQCCDFARPPRPRLSGAQAPSALNIDRKTVAAYLAEDAAKRAKRCTRVRNRDASARTMSMLSTRRYWGKLIGDVPSATALLDRFLQQYCSHPTPPPAAFSKQNGIMVFNPAASVRGPKHVVKKGKTPVLTGQEARQLIDSIETGTIAGLRDRAIIGVLVYSFARVSAALGMDVEDYYPQGRRMWFRLREKGGKHHEVPSHHKAVDYVDAYLEAAGDSLPSC